MDINTAMQKALESTDPAVRGVAIRIRRLEQELAGLNGFLSTYAEGLEEAAVQEPTSAVARRIQHAAKANGGSGIRLSSDDFVMRVKNVLVTNGRPLMITDLYQAYFSTYPDQTKTSPDTFRQRLIKRRQLIILLPGRTGYWPADVAVPNGVDPSHGDAQLAA